MRRSLPLDFEPRVSCSRCQRPERVCYCSHLVTVETKTRVVLLQHPREEDMAIGTARMASLCLPNSELHVGINFEESPALRRALSDPARPAALLYPGEGAVDVLSDPPAGPITLVVVDGTWWQASKLVRTNKTLASLPRYAFHAPRPSEYRIRREPDAAYVSTIEALTHVLGVLEGDPDRVAGLLRPFRAMVDKQIEFATTVRGARVRHNKGPLLPRRSHIPAVFAKEPANIVCVIAEANAWPYRAKELRTSYREELVHWIAYRPVTGEVFDRIVRPRNPLAPSTSPHIDLSEDVLLAGVSREELFRSWSNFVRDDDVLCSWGHYPLTLFTDAGGQLPNAKVDLRPVVRMLLRGRIGTMSVVLDQFGISEELSSVGRGRAGRRGAQLARIARHLIAESQSERSCE